MSHKVLNNVFLKDLGKIDVTSLKTDLLVIPVSTHTKKNNSFKTLDKLSKGYLNKVCNNHFKDKNAPILLPAMQGIAAKNIMLVKDKDSEAQTYKWLDFFASISAKGNSINAKDIAFLVTGNIPKDKDINWFIETAARSFEAGAYIFSETKNKTAKKPSLKNVHLLVDGLSTKELTAAKKSAKQGFAIGEGMNAAKYLGDLPANHATPRIIERKTKALSKEFPKLKVKSLNEKELAKLGMGSYLSVAKGSDEPPRMMIVEYKGGKASDKPIALVGKGITFDTGGISLKPSPAMDEMKWDMCGAASVFGIMTTLARLNADEFLVSILSNTPKYQVEDIAQKIIEDFKSVEVLVNEETNQTLKKTICIGMETYEVNSDKTITDVIKNADIALYEAKNKGRSIFFDHGQLKDEDTIELF